MIFNLFKITYRHLVKNQLFSFINIFGLAFGMTCTLIIALWIWGETRYDQFHAGKDQIFQLMGEMKNNGEATISPYFPSALADPIHQELPEIQLISRTFPASIILQHDENRFQESGLYADPDFFDVFSFAFKQGNAAQLDDPNTIVISESLAQKYFKNAEVLGNTISVIEQNESPKNFKVIGVFESIPKHSSLQFDYVLSYENFEKAFRPWWRPSESGGAFTNFNVTAYVKVATDTRISDFNQKLGHFLANFTDQPVEDQIFAYPFEDIYLRGDFSSGREAGGRIDQLLLLAIIAAVILCIACINFMNLSTAQAGSRAKEVALRKMIGSGYQQLLIQFLFESIILAIIALSLAVTFTHLLLPLISLSFNQPLTLPLGAPEFYFILLSSGLIIGLFTGIYPAIYLSSFKPEKVLKNSLSSRYNLNFMRKALVIFQFAAGFILIVFTITISNQLNFIEKKELGLRKEGVIHHFLYGIKANKEAYRNELLELPEVESVSFSEHHPLDVSNGNRFVHWPGKSEEALIYFNVMQADQYLDEVYDFEVVEGKGFPKQQLTGQKFLINEAAAKAMQVEPIIGSEITVWGKEGEIVGVIKDFHHQKLTALIEPLIIILNNEEVWRAHIAFAEGTNPKESLSKIKDIYNRFEANYPFDFAFIEDQYMQNYVEEQKFSKLGYAFVLITVIISCLGLFGLSAFYAEQKTKESGIRKTLGAEEWSLFKLYAGQFLRLIFLAVIIACPVAWYVGNTWLTGFAYKVEVSLLSFLIASGLTLIIAIITISYHTLKVAGQNPVESLKYE